MYCGDAFNGDKTDDHIPPKKLVPDDLKINLLTVPCCTGCQAGTSADDEWFRDMVAVDGRLPATVRNELYPRLVRSWTSDPQKKWSRTKRITQQLYVTPNGLVYPDVEIDPNNYRMGRVVARIVKALVYVEQGYGSNIRELSTYAWRWEAFRDTLETQAHRQLICDLLTTTQPKTISGILTYWVTFIDPPPELTGKMQLGVWMLLFYGQIAYMGVSGAEGNYDRRATFLNKYQRK